MRFSSPRQFCISLWNMASALQSPKGMQSHSKNPKLPTVKAVYCFDAASIFICQNPDLRSKQEKCPAPTKLSNTSWILGRGYESSFLHAFKWQKLIQNCRSPSFFLTNNTALHHALWLGQIVPDSSISHRQFLTSLTKGRGIHLNHSLKGVLLVTFIICLVEWVQPNSMGSNKNTSWYFANKWQVATASSGSQESNPLKSSSSNNFPCLCLTVSLGVWASWGLSPPPATGTPLVAPASGVLLLPWPLGFSCGGSAGKPYCSLLPWLHSYYLVLTPCMYFVQ